MSCNREKFSPQKNKGLSQGHHNTNTASRQVKKLLKEALATILTKTIICFGNW
jgi:hypothetical protein